MEGGACSPTIASREQFWEPLPGCAQVRAWLRSRDVRGARDLPRARLSTSDSHDDNPLYFGCLWFAPRIWCLVIADTRATIPTTMAGPLFRLPGVVSPGVSRQRYVMWARLRVVS